MFKWTKESEGVSFRTSLTSSFFGVGVLTCIYSVYMYGDEKTNEHDKHQSQENYSELAAAAGCLLFLTIMLLGQLLDSNKHEFEIKHLFPVSFVFIFCHFQTFIDFQPNPNTSKGNNKTNIFKLENITVILCSLSIFFLLVGEIGLSTQMYHQYQTILHQQHLSWSQFFYHNHVLKSKAK